MPEAVPEIIGSYLDEAEASMPRCSSPGRRWRSVRSRHIQRALTNNGSSPKSTVQKVHIASSDKPLTRYGLDAAS